MEKPTSFIKLIVSYIATVAGITLVCFLVYSAIFLAPISHHSTVGMSNLTIEYLNTKYGQHDFKIKKTDDNLDSSGQNLRTTQKGFNIEIQTSLLPENQSFIVRAIGDEANSAVPHHENLVDLLLCNKTHDDYASTGRKMTVECSLDSSKIPKDLGHVPDITELQHFGAISSFHVIMDDPNNEQFDDIELAANYINDFTEQLFAHFKFEGDFAYSVEYHMPSKEIKLYDIIVRETYTEIKSRSDELLFTYKRTGLL